MLDGLDKNGEEVDDELSDESLGEHGGSDLDDEEDGLEDEEADDGPGLSYLLNDSQTVSSKGCSRISNDWENFLEHH